MRVLKSWSMLILAESVHGVLRGLFLVPLVGELRARQIGVAVGSVLVWGMACATVRWMGARSARGWLVVGAVWTTLTLIFEFTLGRVLGLSWDRILSDYDPTRGGFMGAGVMVLLMAPLGAARWRGMLTSSFPCSTSHSK